MAVASSANPPRRGDLIQTMKRLNARDKQLQLDEAKKDLMQIMPADVAETVDSASVARDLQFIHRLFPAGKALNVDDRLRLRVFVASMIEMEGDHISEKVYCMLHGILVDRGVLDEHESK